MGYDSDECITCYMQGFGNMIANNTVHDVCFECIKKVCGGSFDRFGRVTSEVRENFTRVNCDCDVNSDNFGLSSVSMCESCEEKLYEIQCDEHGIHPNDYEKVSCDHCDCEVLHHEDNPGLKTINLCLKCRSIDSLLMDFKYGFEDGSIRGYSKLSDLDHEIEYQELEYHKYYGNSSEFENNPDWSIETASCICGIRFKEVFGLKENNKTDNRYNVCINDYDNYYQDVIRISLTLQIETLCSDIGMEFFLPKEIWDRIRCFLIDKMIT